MKRTNAMLPMPIDVSTAPQPRKPNRSRRVGAIRQMWTSGLVPSSALATAPSLPKKALISQPFRFAPAFIRRSSRRQRDLFFAVGGDFGGLSVLLDRVADEGPEDAVSLDVAEQSLHVLVDRGV